MNREQSDREFAAYVTAHHAMLVGTVTAYVRDRPLAEELVQDALIAAGARWKTVGAYDQPTAWVLRVAFNAANSWFRRQRAGRRALQRFAAGEDGLAVDTHIHDPDPALVAALATVPDRQRRAVTLRHVAGLSVEETAIVLGVSPEATRNLTSRGLAKLRDALGAPMPSSATASVDE